MLLRHLRLCPRTTSVVRALLPLAVPRHPIIPGPSPIFVRTSTSNDQFQHTPPQKHLSSRDTDEDAGEHHPRFVHVDCDGNRYEPDAGDAHHARDDARDAPSSFRFTDENLAEIERIAARYPKTYRKAAVIPVLHLAQAQGNGFLSLAAMNEVARVLEMPRMRVYEVASFYTMYNRERCPAPRHLLQICTTTPCMLRGAADIRDAIRSHLGLTASRDTTPDNAFALIEVECAGACVNAPVVAINDDYYEDLTPETVVRVLEEIQAGRKPTPGPQNGRRGCEPLGPPTSLTEEPPGPGFGMQEIFTSEAATPSRPGSKN